MASCTISSLLIITAALLSIGSSNEQQVGCTGTTWNLICNKEVPEHVDVTTITAQDCPNLNRPPCDPALLKTAIVRGRCASKSLCSVTVDDLGGSICSAKVLYECQRGSQTTPRQRETTPVPEDAWKTDFSSWQWIIIFVMIAVVFIAVLILVVMLLNRFCISKFHQDTPKFVGTPTGSMAGSTMGSRTVSMSTLTRSTLQRPRMDPNPNDLGEIKANFGTGRKNRKDDGKYIVGVASTTLSRRSSGDGAPATRNLNDDSSSGIGSDNLDCRMKHAMYDNKDTCHDDYQLYTMRKQAKLPVVNPGYSTLQTPKKVDTKLYKADQEVPKVDIFEDQREENFRLKIDEWALKMSTPAKSTSQAKQPQDDETISKPLIFKVSADINVEAKPSETSGSDRWIHTYDKYMNSLQDTLGEDNSSAPANIVSCQASTSGKGLLSRIHKSGQNTIRILTSRFRGSTKPIEDIKGSPIKTFYKLYGVKPNVPNIGKDRDKRTLTTLDDKHKHSNPEVIITPIPFSLELNKQSLPKASPTICEPERSQSTRGDLSQSSERTQNTISLSTRGLDQTPNSVKPVPTTGDVNQNIRTIHPSHIPPMESLKKPTTSKRSEGEDQPKRSKININETVVGRSQGRIKSKGTVRYIIQSDIPS